MTTIAIVTITVVAILVLLNFIESRKGIAPTVCKANHVDGCNWEPDSKCPRGLCIAHCVCWCRGDNKHQ